MLLRPTTVLDSRAFRAFHMRLSGAIYEASRFIWQTKTSGSPAGSTGWARQSQLAPAIDRQCHFAGCEFDEAVAVRAVGTDDREIVWEIKILSGGVFAGVEGSGPEYIEMRFSEYAWEEWLLDATLKNGVSNHP